MIEAQKVLATGLCYSVRVSNESLVRTLMEEHTADFNVPESGTDQSHHGTPLMKTSFLLSFTKRYICGKSIDLLHSACQENNIMFTQALIQEYNTRSFWCLQHTFS